MIPKTSYILDTDDKIPVITRQLLKKHHSNKEVLDFVYFMWGTRLTRTDDGQQCFEATKYEEWLDKKLPVHYIPSSEYKTSYDMSIITDDLLHIYHTGKERKAFYNWMYGQTWMLTEDGKAGYYTWDYERWLRKLPIID